VIVVCNEGYASSLAAATLRSIGVRRATDLAGGYRAWSALRAGT
jgi:rhodanese-related sulfurtransferase